AAHSKNRNARRIHRQQNAQRITTSSPPEWAGHFQTGGNFMASKQTPSDFFAPDIIVDNVINFACSQIKHRRKDGKPDHTQRGWIVESLMRDGKLGWLQANDPSEGMYLVQGDDTRSRYGETSMVAQRSQATSAAPFNVPTDYDGIAPCKVSILS